MQQTVKQRLIEFLKYLGVGQNKFEEEVGWGNGYITHMKDKKLRQPQISSLKDRYPNLNIDWLQDGVGNMLLPVPTYSTEEEAMFANTELYKSMKKQIEELQGKMSIGGDNITIGDKAKGSFRIKNSGEECKLCAEKERLIASLEEQILAKDELIRALKGEK
ncbi:MAG: hypothetical protein MJZ30_09310 [Paludibacteraceae bacterium]|nr:hypothetical protein [Paludibacteraceae bacterium]